MKPMTLLEYFNMCVSQKLIADDRYHEKYIEEFRDNPEAALENLKKKSRYDKQIKVIKPEIKETPKTAISEVSNFSSGKLKQLTHGIS